MTRSFRETSATSKITWRSSAIGMMKPPPAIRDNLTDLGYQDDCRIDWLSGAKSGKNMRANI